jgi:ketosteroid isomerase-like protein
MSPSENKRVIETAFAALQHGDTAPYLDMLADDIRFSVIGSTKWSGTYQGKRDLLKRLLRPVRERLVPQFKQEIQSIVAEGDRLVLEYRAENITKNGKPYNNTYCWVCRMNEGKITELTEYLDTELVTVALSD